MQPLESALASQGRHPSSHIQYRPTGCDVCGFMPPARDDTADAFRELPVTWYETLRREPSSVEPAARLRDELHAVTNRVERLVAAPGSPLARVSIHAPTALALATSRGVLTRLLQMSAGRLAELVDSLPPAAWDIDGRVAGGTVTVEELLHVPLHHSHRDLAGWRTDGAIVVLLGRRAAHAPAALR